MSAQEINRPRRSRPGVFYLVLALAATVPLYTNGYQQFMASMILVYVLVTVGFNLVIGNLGQLAFANTAFFGIGAYTTAIVMTHFGASYDIALVAAAAAGGLAGVLASIAALRGIRIYYLAIITLAFSELMRWVYIHAEQVTMGTDGLPMPKPELFGFAIHSSSVKYWVFLTIVTLVVMATSNLLRSRIGRAIVSIRDNELATASLGISTGHYIVLAFAWSGTVVGIAGAMFAALTERVFPESFGLIEVIVHFAMVLVGGTGSLIGSVIGGITLTVLPEYFRQFPGMAELFFGIIIVLVLLFLPKGLASLLARLSPVFQERFYRE